MWWKGFVRWVMVVAILVSAAKMESGFGCGSRRSFGERARGIAKAIGIAIGIDTVIFLALVIALITAFAAYVPYHLTVDLTVT